MIYEQSSSLAISPFTHSCIVGGGILYYRCNPPKRRRRRTWQLGRSVLKFGSISHDKNDTYATCNLCKKSISSKGGNTTNMNKHLNTQHGIKLQECHVFDACSSSANVGASSFRSEEHTSELQSH